MIVGLNGKLLDERQAVVSVFDHGFLYGIGLFETFRTYGGVPFLLRRHLERLAAGCRELGIRYAPDEAALRQHIAALMAANGLDEAYVRLSVSAGAEAIGLPSGDYGKPNVIVYVKPLPEPDSRWHTEGRPLQLLRTPRNTPEGEVRLKSFHYMNNIMAKRELDRYPWAKGAEGLFFSASGHVAEGIVSNVFMIGESALHTPSLATGILPGVTRAHVLELAESLGIRTEQGFYTQGDFSRFSAMFLTNSIMEIVPVSRIYDAEGRTVWEAEDAAGAHPLIRRLTDSYRASITRGLTEDETP